jgi:lipopolysaccharide export system protein LptC
MRNTVVLIVLALLAAATGLLRWQRATPDPRPTVDESTSPLGYYVIGARLLGTDEQGRVAYRVFATRLDEVPGEQLLTLEGATVDYRPDGETPWTLSATTARAPKDGSEIDLVGDVELKSAPTDGSEPTTVVTQKLTFSPDRSSAETDEAVTMTVGDWQLQGIGLDVDLKGDLLELKSQVHGVFFPR